VPASDEQVFLFVGRLSPLLTVWRRLHLDLDSMGPITGNFVTGTVEGVEHMPNAQPIALTKLILSEFPANFEEENHFRSPGRERYHGRVALSKPGLEGAELWVEEDEMNWGDDVLYVGLDTGLSSYVGGTYELRDDDFWATYGKTIPPVSLPRTTLNTTVLSGAIAHAYVTVEPYDQQEDSTFQVNVEDEDTAEENLSEAGGTGTSQWWVAHVTAAFQGTHEEDADEENAFELGITDVDAIGPGDGSFSFLETLREWADRSGDALQELEGQDVAHEVGHQFGLDHHKYNNETYLMAGEEELTTEDGDPRPRQHPTSYDPPDLAAIRGVDHPITDP
jgi:hypothetical protein